jgi:hypothetical protein
MIWGMRQTVPATSIWVLLLLVAALVLVALRILRVRPRTMGIAALVLAFAVPLSAKALTLPYSFTNGTVADANQVNANFAALANGRIYGFVNPDGTLDAGINGGIIAVTNPVVGYYCFKLGGPAKNAVASIDPTTTGAMAIVMTFVPHAGSGGLANCPADFSDAGALVRNVSGAQVNAGFYVSFQ